MGNCFLGVFYFLLVTLFSVLLVWTILLLVDVRVKFVTLILPTHIHTLCIYLISQFQCSYVTFCLNSGVHMCWKKNTHLFQAWNCKYRYVERVCGCLFVVSYIFFVIYQNVLMSLPHCTNKIKRILKLSKFGPTLICLFEFCSANWIVVCQIFQSFSSCYWYFKELVWWLFFISS